MSSRRILRLVKKVIDAIIIRKSRKATADTFSINSMRQKISLFYLRIIYLKKTPFIF